ncbi:MAG: VTC domain-containing protein [Muribaculaceae bacterium]|nr:VTC domain-containing protein [Muribaculaceae bacterium]
MEELLQRMKSITLEEMSGVKLMNRIDTKFLTTLPVLFNLLELANDKFMVQETNNLRNSPYYTRYYDTPEALMFYDHQRGKKSRRKIRIREYLNSGVNPFLEIKDKNNKGRTKKKRVIMNESKDILDYKEFIGQHSEFNAENLFERIENYFNRITLVNNELSERITIDTSVKFYNFVSGRKISIPELVIIEWKRDGLSAKSRLKPILQQLRIKESGFSKYVIGTALTDPSLPQNRLKPRLHQLEKLIG